ncbi:MAG TPA: histidine phosphatase family protein [Mycobacteriales bacterium]|nr:histidine phosphatase family protein [Mycobacteriales bacterium]
MLYVVRHAEQAGEAEESDPGLSTAGREQARRLALRLRATTLETIHHSPARRAVETARLLGELTGVRTEESELVRDRTPLPGPDDDSYPQWFAGWSSGIPAAEGDPGGRALEATVRCFANRPGDRLIVTHAFVVGWFVRHALDAPSSAWLRLAPAHTGLTVIDYPPGRPPRLVAVNDVGHLLGPPPGSTP